MQSARGESIYIPDDHVKIPTHLLNIPLHYKDDIEYILIPNGLIVDRIEALATEIFNDYGDEPLVVLCVLKGGYRFFGELTNRLQSINRTYRTKSVPLTVDFIRLKSYKNTVSAGEPELIGNTDMSHLKGMNVLVVEDIVDTGKTIKKLLEILKNFEPRNVRVCSLLTKRTPLSNGYLPDYSGFSVPNKYVVGYAFDVNEHFRDMDHISIFKTSGYEKYMKK